MSEPEGPRTPRQTIERIRTHRYLLDLGSESERVREGALNLQTELNNALKLLSQDLYSKKSHFLLELVQNADDNHYGPGVVPQLTFKVTTARFVVVNNELGFSEPNVQAICSVGRSSKGSKKAGYIGEKGIGFKSVFVVSNAPEIHSNGYHFRFDRRDEGNLLGYVVPQWCEPPEDAQANQTTIILPAGNDIEFGEQTLAGLEARLLLFLHKLRELSVEHDGKRVIYRRKDEDDLSLLTAKHEPPGVSPSVEETRYVRSELTFSMEKFPDEKRPGIDRSSVVLAFPVDANGAANPEPSSHVFAFLPVRQVGFKFAIQADFILSSSREDILTDRPWNLHLRAGIATVFRSAIDSFKKTEALAFSYLKYLPAKGEVSDAFFKSVGQQILELLAKSECLPSASGQWKFPSNLRLANKRFRELFPSKTALELFGFDYVDYRVQGGSELLRSLGTKDVLLQDILSVFKNHGPWLQKQPLEWRAEFYAYLADQRKELVSEGLLQYACLPTAGGTLAVPARTNVFFPLSKGKRYGFEDELVFVDNELFEQAKQYSETVPELFAEFKVKSDDPYDLVMSHILPKHKGDSWKTSEHKALVGHLRYVKDKLKAYLERAAAHGNSEAQAFQLLRDGIWVGTKHREDGRWWFARADKLYLGKEYKPLFCMESHLGEALAQDRIVSADYLAAKPKDPDTEAETWRHFFARLGLCFSPTLEAVGADWQCGNELQLLLDSPQPAVRKATLECLDQHWSTYLGRLTYDVRHVHRGRHSIIQRDTSFVLRLRGSQAPTKRKAIIALSDSFYPTPDLKELLGDNLPYVEATLSSPMLDACRITYKLDAMALIKRLKQLKAEGGDTAKQLQGIYRNLERLWTTDAANIKLAFQADALIRTKGIHKSWSEPDEVSWRSNGTFLDSLYPPLQGQYRDFSGFFLDKLGLPRELPTAKRVEALTRLESVESTEARRDEALNIYRRANRDLAPKVGRDEPPHPGWLVTFEDEPVFINHRDEMVTNDEFLFANDAPELAALFVDDKELSFIGIPSAEVPRLGRLLDATGVQRLSSSLQLKVIDAEAGVIDAELTSRVRRSLHFLARVLYAKSHDSFEGALENGLFARLRELEVAQAPQVNLLVTLGEATRETEADIALGDGRVLYRSGATAVKDRLAAELCRFLGAPDELADTFARVLMEEGADSTEDFLKVRNIGVLPADLLEALETSAGSQGQNAVGDAPRESEIENVGITVGEPQKDEPPTPTGGQEEEVEPPKATHKSSSGTAGVDGDAAKPPSDGSGASPSTPRPSPAPTTPRPSPDPASRSEAGGSATPPSSGPPPQAGALPGGPTGNVAGTQSSTVLKEGSVRVAQRDGSAPGPEAEQRAAPHVPGKGAQPSIPNWTPPGNVSTSMRHRARRGQSHRPRTKSGRLMSYAAGPGNPDRPNPDDDPSKAAAREATSKAAVEYFLTTQGPRWQSLTEMPHNNPGFDVHALAHDGEEEFIEVKGQSAAWTEDGIALTPKELETAQNKGERYWLCIVEHVYDERRRQLYLLRNPYGLTQQFRFDSGWKSAAIRVGAVPLLPEKGMLVEIPGIGQGRIQSVRTKGRFFNLHVILEDGRQVNKPFNPATMKLSSE